MVSIRQHYASRGIEYDVPVAANPTGGKLRQLHVDILASGREKALLVTIAATLPHHAVSTAIPGSVLTQVVGMPLLGGLLDPMLQSREPFRWLAEFAGRSIRTQLNCPLRPKDLSLRFTLRPKDLSLRFNPNTASRIGLLPELVKARRIDKEINDQTGDDSSSPRLWGLPPVYRGFPLRVMDLVCDCSGPGEPQRLGYSMPDNILDILYAPGGVNLADCPDNPVIGIRFTHLFD